MVIRVVSGCGGTSRVPIRGRGRHGGCARATLGNGALRGVGVTLGRDRYRELEERENKLVITSNTRNNLNIS